MYKIIGADGKEYGPITADQLRQWVKEGRVNPQTKVLPEGETEWRLLSSLPEFAPLVEPPMSAPIGNVPAFQSQRTNSMALTGMIMGILSFVLGCCCYGLPFNLLGLIFSLIGLYQIRNEPQTYSGKGMAIAGLVLSILNIVLVAVLLILGVALNWNEISSEFNKL